MNRLKELREASGLSQSGLSREAGIPIRTIQAYEQGQRDMKIASVTVVYKLTKALRCTVSELLNDDFFE